MRLQDIIRRPLVTEKTAVQREVSNVVVFEVAAGTNKIQVKKAVEALFAGVKVVDVRIANMHGKTRRVGRFVGRRSDWKKAYIRLADDSKKIEIFEGV
jgi:large subunit ribosomal protein L23